MGYFKSNYWVSAHLWYEIWTSPGGAIDLIRQMNEVGPMDFWGEIDWSGRWDRDFPGPSLPWASLWVRQEASLPSETYSLFSCISPQIDILLPQSNNNIIKPKAMLISLMPHSQPGLLAHWEPKEARHLRQKSLTLPKFPCWGFNKRKFAF